VSLKAKEIEEQALQLPHRERAELIRQLIKSLDEEEDIEAEKLWLEEAERRYKEYKKGKIKAKSAETVFKDARSILK